VKRIACAALAFALLGCATKQPIADVVDAPVLAGSGRTLTRAEVATAINRAGRSLGWQMIVDGPGLFTGRLLLRSHVAEVQIEHGAKTYDIRYRDSVNLDAGDGAIHHAYNRWVEKLERAIRKELELL
jgi:hypothetical protein